MVDHRRMREMYRYEHDFAYRGAMKLRGIYGYSDQEEPLPFLGIQMIPDDIERLALDSLERHDYNLIFESISLASKRIVALVTLMSAMARNDYRGHTSLWSCLFRILYQIEWPDPCDGPQPLDPNVIPLSIAVADFFAKKPAENLPHQHVIFKIACLKIFRDHILTPASPPKEIEYCRRTLHHSDQRHLPVLAQVAEPCVP